MGVTRGRQWTDVALGAEVPHRVTSGKRPDSQLNDAQEDDLASLVRRCWDAEP